MASLSHNELNVWAVSVAGPILCGETPSHGTCPHRVPAQYWQNHPFICSWYCLTHWGRVTHICVGKLTIIGSDNGLSPERRQAIIWTNARILLMGPLGTNFSEMSIEIQTFSLKKIRLKMSSAKFCSFRLGLNELTRKIGWCFLCCVCKKYLPCLVKWNVGH